MLLRGGATTHLFSGAYTDFAVRGGNAELGKIDSNAIRLANHTEVARFMSIQ